MNRSGNLASILALGMFATFLVLAVPPARADRMLYLVEFETIESEPQATGGVPAAVELRERLIVPSLERLADHPMIESGGIVLGGHDGVFIIEARSHDEVFAVMRALPAWGVWDWKVTPLQSFTSRAALEKKMIQELRAQP